MNHTIIRTDIHHLVRTPSGYLFKVAEWGFDNRKHWSQRKVTAVQARNFVHGMRHSPIRVLKRDELEIMRLEADH